MVVLTETDDPTADVVIAELNRREVPVVRLDPAEDFPNALEFSACHQAGRIAGTLATPTRALELNRVRAVYHRRPSPYARPAADAPHAERFTAAQTRYGLGGVLASLDCRYVNHPWRVLACEHKPWQLGIATQAGFAIPPTLITNRAADVRRFAKRHGPIVYKTLREVPGQDEAGRWCTVWVDEVTLDRLDESIVLAPHMFQARIPKLYDLRLTVIGPAMFCVRIESPHLDWREDYDKITYSVADVPAGIADAAARMLVRAGLVFGAFDLGVATDGQIWFYELNAGGQWAWLEDETGLPMTAAVADLLEGTATP